MSISVCSLSCPWVFLYSLHTRSPSQGVPVHDSLAVRLCNEILRDPKAPEVRLYTKSLSCLELSTEDSPLRKDLLLLLQEIQQVSNRAKQGKTSKTECDILLRFSNKNLLNLFNLLKENMESALY